MKRVVLAVVAAVCAANLSAQNPKTGGADADWNALNALLKPAPTATITVTPGATPDQILAATNAAGGAGAKKTAADVATERVKRTNTARQAAQAAHDFYTRYPADPHAVAARKIEAIQSLLGAADDNPGQEVGAQKIADSYRKDKTNSVADRFDVALLSERVKLRSKHKGEIFVNAPAELEKVADGLIAEFGDLPQAHYFYTSVARSADMANARRMADKILQRNAPSEAKAEAQSIIERDGWVGKPLDLQLTTIDGKTIDLSKPVGVVTILYVWPGGGAATMADLLHAKGKIPANTRIVYLCVGGSGILAQAAQAGATMPGLFSLEAVNAAIRAVPKLHVQTMPYVFVITAAGNLSGFGPSSELSNLLTTKTH
jgi:hypothetical protein